MRKTLFLISLIVVSGACTGDIVKRTIPGRPGSTAGGASAGVGGGASEAGGNAGTGGSDAAGGGNEAGGTNEAGGGFAGGMVEIDAGIPVVPVTALRRLTSREIDRTLQMLTGETHAHAKILLPATSASGPAATPYDNDILGQLPSVSWIEGVENLANTVVKETLADATRKALVMPCTPSSNTDMVCLEKFIRTFGRKALRRPITDAEVITFKSLHTQALERGDFMTSVGLIMTRMLADPEFHFRPEIGTPVAADVVQLNGNEIASRLSFFLQGRAPTDWLLADAASGALNTSAGVKTAALKLMGEPEGKAHVEQFHAMWLGFSDLPHDATFNSKLVTETSALVRRTLFEQPGDYRRLFNSTDTYVDATLATHYGLSPIPTGTAFAWTPYGNSGRKGILGHASLLSNGVKQSDTSPTLRGLWIRNRLFCQEVPPPPPTVAMDLPPAMGTVVCKKDRLAAHTSGSCAYCHDQMDPVGFGLEQYDNRGKFRMAEAAFPQCSISGAGSLLGFGNFTGSSGLADLMMTSGQLEECVVRQLFQFQVGRSFQINRGYKGVKIAAEEIEDKPLVKNLTKTFETNGRRFDLLLAEIVSHPMFLQRRLETP
jgi:hypothetical protein